MTAVPVKDVYPCFYSICIRESVDSLCRDGADTPTINKCNGSELSNTAAISPLRNTTWPTSVSRHDNTLKGDRKHRYNGIREIAKTYGSRERPFTFHVHVSLFTFHFHVSLFTFTFPFHVSLFTFMFHDSLS